MILGIGTDLCAIARMERAAERDGFVERVFTEEEIAYARSRGRAAEHFASAFAAKEAMAKATGLGIFRMGTRQCSVVRTDDGPKLRAHGELARRLDEMGVKRTWLSLSHDCGMAVAFVVLEG